MSDTYGNPDILSYFFSRPTKPGELSYEDLQNRRRIATALAARSRKFPTSIGEGMTYFGEKIAEGLEDRDLAAAEKSQREYDLGARKSLFDVPAPTPAPNPAAPITPPPPPAAPAQPQRPPIQAAPIPPNMASANGAAPPVQQASLQTPDLNAPAPGSMPIDEVLQRVGRVETGGHADPYQAVGPRSRRGDYPYGKYQVMGENIPKWSQAHLGREMTPQEFLKDPDAQETIARKQLQSYVDRFGNTDDAAAAWFAGPNFKNRSPDVADVLGTHIKEYQRRFNLPLPASRQDLAKSLTAQASPTPVSEEEDARLADVTGVAQPKPRVQLASLRDTPEPPVPSSPMGSMVDAGVEQASSARRELANAVANQRVAQTGGGAPATAAPAPPPTTAPQPKILPAPPTAQGQIIAEPKDPGPEPTLRDFMSRDPQSLQQMNAAQRILSDPRTSPTLKSEAQQIFNNLERRAAENFQRHWTQWKGDSDKYQAWQLATPERSRAQATFESQQAAAAQALQEAKRKEALHREFGDIPMETLTKRIEKSTEDVKALPQATQALRDVRAQLDQGMFTGLLAPGKVMALKAVSAVTGTSDPRVVATETFQAAGKPLLAAARQAQSGGANISDNDMKLAAQAVAGDITLEGDTMRRVMDALERIQLQTALHHQGVIASVARDNPERNAVLYGSYGIPLGTMAQIVPAGAKQHLLSDPSPDAVAEFNKTFKTPGLAEMIIQRNRR